MKVPCVLAVAYTVLVVVSALETESNRDPRMHRRLVEMKSNNGASDRNKNLRGGTLPKKNSSVLLSSLDEMPVPEPAKIKTSN